MLRVVPFRADPIANLADRREGAWLTSAWIAAAAVHAAAALVLPRSPQTVVEARPSATEIIEVQPVEPVPPEERTPQSPAEPPTPSDPVKSASSFKSPSDRASPAPAAVPLLAQASAEDSDLVDLTDSFVTGSAPAHRGPGARGSPGSHSGRSVGSPAGTSSRSGSPGPNRARAASVWGEPDWNCPFPPEADRNGVDRAATLLRVELSSRGAVNRVVVLRDPGHGFGAAARRCALGKRYHPALDAEGRPIPAALVLSVRFVR